MHQSIPGSSPRPALRVLRDEDSPAYDAQRRSGGFGMIPREVFDRAGDSFEIAVYAALVMLADRSGTCVASVQAIASGAKCSRAKAALALAALIERGHVTRKARTRAVGGKGASEYRLPLHPTKPMSTTEPSMSTTKTSNGRDVDIAMSTPETYIYTSSHTYTPSSTARGAAAADDERMKTFTTFADEAAVGWTRLDRDLTSGWLRRVARSAFSQYPGVDVRSFGLALESARAAVTPTFQNGKVRASARALAEKVILERVQEMQP